MTTDVILTLLILSVSIFTGYLVFVITKFEGVLPSISDSYYELEKKKKNSGILFTFALWLFAIPVMIAAEKGLMFGACAGICFVGAASAFKQDMTGKVHNIGAIGGICLGLASLWLDFGLWYFVIPMLAIIGVIYRFRETYCKNYIWWIELVAFYGIVGGLFIGRLKLGL